MALALWEMKTAAPTADAPVLLKTTLKVVREKVHDAEATRKAAMTARKHVFATKAPLTIDGTKHVPHGKSPVITHTPQSEHLLCETKNFSIKLKVENRGTKKRSKKDKGQGQEVVPEVYPYQILEAVRDPDNSNFDVPNVSLNRQGFLEWAKHGNDAAKAFCVAVQTLLLPETPPESFIGVKFLKSFEVKGIQKYYEGQVQHVVLGADGVVHYSVLYCTDGDKEDITLADDSAQGQLQLGLRTLLMQVSVGVVRVEWGLAAGQFTPPPV